MEYKISEKTANEILQYLGTRPYAEVYTLIAALRNIQPIETPQTENTETK